MFWLFHLARRDLNVILNRMKQAKTPSSFQIIIVSLRSSFSDEGIFSIGAREKPMETVD